MLTDLSRFLNWHIGDSNWHHPGYLLIRIRPGYFPSNEEASRNLARYFEMNASNPGETVDVSELDVSCNYITYLPPALSRLNTLTTLVLGQNQLTGAAPSLDPLMSLTKLEVLRLDFNAISILPAGIVHLTALRILSLQKNSLSELPDDLCRLTALTELDVNENKLTRLPNSLTQLTGLTNLHANNNCIYHLSDDFTPFTYLQRLNLSSNQLRSLPLSMARLSSACVIIARENPMFSDNVALFVEAIAQIKFQNTRLGPLVHFPSSYVDDYVEL